MTNQHKTIKVDRRTYGTKAKDESTTWKLFFRGEFPKDKKK